MQSEVGGSLLYTLHSRTSHKGFMWLWSSQEPSLKLHFILVFVKVLQNLLCSVNGDIFLGDMNIMSKECV